MRKTLVFIGVLLASLSLTGVAQTTHHHERHHKQASSVASVNLNQASMDELVKLKGVGDKKAQAIVAYRKQHGDFKSVEDLAKVKGIGVKMLERIERNNPGKLKVTS